MTCVVGVRTRTGVLLAGDRQLSWDNGKRFTRDAKTLELSEIIAVACCGSPRLGQLLQFHMDELDDPPLGRDEQRWAVREFIPFLREVTEQAGHLTVRHDDAVEGLGDSAFLMAVRGRLFMVEGDFSVTEHRFGFEALGSGMETAIGAMHAAAVAGRTGEATYEPYTQSRAQAIAEAGVKAATDYTSFVGGQMTTAETALYTDEELSFARSMVKR